MCVRVGIILSRRLMTRVRRRVVVVSGPLPVRPLVRISRRVAMEAVRVQRVQQSVRQVNTLQQGQQVVQTVVAVSTARKVLLLVRISVRDVMEAAQVRPVRHNAPGVHIRRRDRLLVRRARRTVTVPRDRVRRKPVQPFRLWTAVPNRVRLQMVPAVVGGRAHVIAAPVRRVRMHQVIVRVPKVVAVIAMVHAM